MRPSLGGRDQGIDAGGHGLAKTEQPIGAAIVIRRCHDRIAGHTGGGQRGLKPVERRLVVWSDLDLDQQQHRTCRRARDLRACEGLVGHGAKRPGVHVLDRRYLERPRQRHVACAAVAKDSGQCDGLGIPVAPDESHEASWPRDQPELGVHDDAERAFRTDEEIDEVHFRAREISG